MKTMMRQQIENKILIGKEKKIFTYIVAAVLLISLVLISNIFLNKDVNGSYLESTLGFIKFFNSVLSMLAFGTCLISYNRLKKDSIFIISLMYLGLAMGILLGHIDYFSFYYDEFTISNYITVSTSLLRIFILIVAILPNNKLRLLIVKNKEVSILFVIIYSIVFGFLENRLGHSKLYDSSQFFILYNIFLMIIYVTCSVKLFTKGIKEKDYLFIILSSSIFMLAIKAIYAIYGINIVSFYVKLTSVSITYICLLIVILGAFFELYMYICKTKLLNDNLSVFYNLTDNNKHNFMFILSEDEELLYANKKIKEHYLKSENSDINEIEFILKQKINSIGRKEEIMNSLDKNGVWRGIIKNEINNKTIDCSIQSINMNKNKRAIAINYMDISDEISIELELEKLKVYDKEKSEFISNISHELRTPLNIFYSTIQLLDKFSTKEDLDFKLTYAKYKKTLHLNCKRMLKLINNVIDISKIDIGLLKANFENYDIVSIVEEVTLSVVNYALLKSINIQFDTNKEEHIIKCDSSMIERMMLNLLSNAIKFSQENKNIYVRVFITDEWIQIDVQDEGMGISKNAQQIIFEKFIQADKSFTRMNEGSGIGLSIVKSIINLHEGDIYVDSEINKGSILKILLPNKRLESLDFKVYDINNYNIELELSDIYQILV
jgi:hypothetical protein